MSSGFDWMIYGANGYTGSLIAKKAVDEGMRPVLAGRSEAKIRPLAEKLGVPWRAFNLEDAESGLEGMKLVLHCAGPFVFTSRAMVKACLRQGVHYLDITGEIPVFEAVHRKDQEAKQTKLALIPGVGFDVVPSDCLAAMVAGRLPGATHLEIAFNPNGKASQGTMKTALLGMPFGGTVRREGRLERVPLAHEVKEAPFSNGKTKVVAVPWGDVSTAYFSTGIPNITCYMAQSEAFIRTMRFARPFAGVLAVPFVRNALTRYIEKNVKGPSEADRERGRCYLWAKATKGNETAEATMEVAEGYHFTVVAALACVRKVLAGTPGPGAWTPSRAFGPNFVESLPGTKISFS